MHKPKNNVIFRYIKHMMLAPFCLLPMLGMAGEPTGMAGKPTGTAEPAAAGKPSPEERFAGVDFDKLAHIVEGRIQRAENGVIRDYLAQKGLTGEDAEEAAEHFRLLRAEGQSDSRSVQQLKKRCADAELAAADALSSVGRLTRDYEARLEMLRLGVGEQYFEDVLLLAERESEGMEQTDDGDGEGGDIRSAVASVVARVPGFVTPKALLGGNAGHAVHSGSKGSFPRKDDAGTVMQRQLDDYRASGDNASAVALISQAAQRGITLR